MRYGPASQVSPLCGSTIEVTNLNNGNKVECLVADACPSCAVNSLDLSLGAFDALDNRAVGIIPSESSTVLMRCAGHRSKRNADEYSVVQSHGDLSKHATLCATTHARMFDDTSLL